MWDCCFIYLWEYIYFEGLAICYMYVMYISIFVRELFQSPSAWSQHSDDINMVSYVCMYVCRYVCMYVYVSESTVVLSM